MKIENLTKENFWNEMYQKYPKTMKKFCDWIDKYKEENNWKELFNEKESHFPALEHKAPKFHDLPIAMQWGIWWQFSAAQYKPSKEEIRDFLIANIEADLEYMEETEY